MKLFKMYGFQRALYNTLIISFAKLIFGFPIPILFALLLNEVNNITFKKFVQTTACLPNFISWVVVHGFIYALLSPSSGAIREVANMLNYQGEIVNLMMSKDHFRQLLVGSEIWKDFGYSSILYIATISTIDQQLYEAAKVDSAGKLRQMWNITLPGLRSTIIIILILKVGRVLDAGFEQIYTIYNPAVYEVADILDTFIYKLGIERMNFAVSTAAGVFKSVIGLVLVMVTNYITGRIDKDCALIQ